MKYIDLHIHSCASDGSLSPSETVRLAAGAGLSAMALTDHDTTDGIEEAAAAARLLSIEMIPGIELSCLWEGKEIHILGLYVEPGNPVFAADIAALRKIRQDRNEEMIRRFQTRGINITWEDVVCSNLSSAVTRAHFALALVKKGYASSSGQAFKKYLQYGDPYCIRKETVTPEQAIGILSKSRAFPSLAHPCQYKLGKIGTEKLVGRLKELGLMGLEVYHSSHKECDSAFLLKTADNFGLVPTGGSDFHGSAKPDIAVGTGRGHLRVPESLLYRVKNALTLAYPEKPLVIP